MSSLLQFTGETGRKGVNLQFMLQDPDDKYRYPGGVDTFVCSRCNKIHDSIFTAWRKPVGMLGCWVVFRYLGTEHVPDLSVPIAVLTLPRGAVRMTQEAAEAYWHSS